MRKLLALMLSLCMIAVPTVTMSGCSAAQFIQVLNEVGPAVGVILQIVALSKGTTANLALQTKVDADTAALNKLYEDFESSATANKGSVDAEINGAFSTLQNDLSQVFVLAQVSNPNTQNKLTSLVGLIQGLVQIAEAAVPSTAPAALAKAPAVSADQFIKTWNKTLTAKTGDAKVDAFTASHQYHRHNAFVRMLTFGKAQ